VRGARLTPTLPLQGGGPCRDGRRVLGAGKGSGGLRLGAERIPGSWRELWRTLRFSVAVLEDGRPGLRPPRSWQDAAAYLQGLTPSARRGRLRAFGSVDLLPLSSFTYATATRNLYHVISDRREGENKSADGKGVGNDK
jgi:hypothetical protein